MSKRSIRELHALRRTGSTSRLLNLALLSERHARDPQFTAKPLFRIRALNTSMILKHRLRANETHFFESWRQNATKVILPFDVRDLRLGGQSFFVGQTGWEATMRDYLAAPDGDLAHDQNVLTLISELPSLDPFLLREHLRRNGIEAAPAYFDITPADHERMLRFVREEIRQLVALAFKVNEAAGDPASRMAEAMLGGEMDGRLEPLRATLRLEGDAFREGVFCWKGFLYYKWSRTELRASVERVLKEIPRLLIVGPRDGPSMTYVGEATKRVRQNLVTEYQRMGTSLAAYDKVYDDLVKGVNPGTFREFLLNAPRMFLELGECVGAVSHIAGFWRYRFPNAERLDLAMEEALDILQDFEGSLTRLPATAAA